MKTIFKSALTILLGLLFSGNVLLAQEKTQAKQFLTETQKTMLKNEFNKKKEMKEAFRATLTQEQKDMLTDPRLVKADRIKAFRASFTDKQVNMIKARQQEVKAMKDKFRSTLTDQQKMQFKKMIANRGKINKTTNNRGKWHQRMNEI